ncbi:hypothetical protein GCM10022232_91090 [Streptomyces plumbiresistens]|uniref:Uncharacterized protein n=1 Tax=Streptomyces plumbiresistens TaxID=511811 RepID=A0ABP7TTB1_9ACTN
MAPHEQYLVAVVENDSGGHGRQLDQVVLIAVAAGRFDVDQIEFYLWANAGKLTIKAVSSRGRVTELLRVGYRSSDGP